MFAANPFSVLERDSSSKIRKTLSFAEPQDSRLEASDGRLMVVLKLSGVDLGLAQLLMKQEIYCADPNITEWQSSNFRSTVPISAVSG